jgi:hypothetical protein
MGKFRKHAKQGTLPRFSFIEPNYVNKPDFGLIRNDDHPPANPLQAQKFIAEVYETLRNSPKWGKTLFIVTYPITEKKEGGVRGKNGGQTIIKIILLFLICKKV